MTLGRTLLMMLTASFSLLAQNGKLPTCDDTEFHQFDFWVGDWEVRSGGETIGYSRVEPLLNGCLLMENWYGLDGDIGKSMNFFNKRTGKWRSVSVSATRTSDAELSFTSRNDGVIERIENGLRITYLQSAIPSGVDRDTNARCLSSQARQFDFWAGEWDVFGPRGRSAGTNAVLPIAGGCVLFENWSGAGGVDGKSFNFVDSATGEWRQVWVSAGGNLDLRGKWENGHLRLIGENTGANGAKHLQRITWTPRIDGAVRQHWEQSGDGGATWVTAFDGLYLRRIGV